METRKVQQVGYSTLAVSLPKDWTAEVGLKRGDVITFRREADRSLTLFPGIETEERETYKAVINADLCNEPELLTRIITGSYILGCDSIEVFSKTELRPGHLEEVRNTTHRLTGIGIVEQRPNQVIIQSFVDPNKFPVEGLIRRLHIIASSMQLTATRALFEFKPELTNEVLRMEEEADRIYWLVIRQLLLTQRDYSQTGRPGLTIVGYRVIAKCVEAIADYAAYIAREVSQIEEVDHEIYSEVFEELSQLDQLVQTISNKTVEAFFKRNIKLSNSIIETTNIVVEKERTFAEEIVSKITDISIATAIRSISWSLRQISRYSKEIAEITINWGLAVTNDLCTIERI